MLKSALKVIIVLTLGGLALATDLSVSDQIRLLGHELIEVSSYASVQQKVNELFEQGVDADNIMVLTDWDDTINKQGAWKQKDPNGNYFHPYKRMLLEHEVDHTLRDPNTQQILKYLRSKNVKTIVATARPPIIDTDLASMAKWQSKSLDLMDERLDSNPDVINYEKIGQTIYELIQHMAPETLNHKARHKVRKMQHQSGIDLTGQPGLEGSLSIDLDRGQAIFHNGYAFIGHDKGPVVYKLLNKLRRFPAHIIVIDDNPRAIDSYIKELTYFKKAGATVHLLYYPINER